MVGICPLDNPIREYAWGSRSAIAELLGQPAPSPRPQAELWMGAHPSDPSSARCAGVARPLPELVREDPRGVLGKRVAARFESELPFLFKVLAASQPLSIQAHPDAEQAREGFERENAAGIALGARERNYPDPRAKPELLCALSRFSALCGFRPTAQIARAFRAAQIDGFARELEALEHGAEQALEQLFASVWRAPSARLERAIAQALAHARQRPEEPAARWITAIAALYPGDAGVLAPLFLNLVELAPGDALYLGARELHSYLEGVGIELMANSDNVLRGGLTAKHVDVPELCHVLRFESREPQILRPRRTRSRELLYETPADAFELAQIRVSESRPWRSARSRSVEILLATEGSMAIEDRGTRERLELPRGGSVLIPSSVESYELAGAGVAYRASVPKRARRAGSREQAARGRRRSARRGRR